MNFRLKNIALSVMILLVTFMVTGKDIFSENNAKIVVKKSINLCKEDNTRFTFGVNIGEVKTTDSLFGFDIEIKYDPTKVKIINALSGNTLSEIFKEQSFSYGYEENKVKGYATTMEVNIVPPSGNKDLIAFFAEWIGSSSCADSSLIEITRLEFTDEFQKKISSFEPAKVYTYNKPEAKDNIEVTSVQKEVNLKSGETQFTLKYTINRPKVSNESSYIINFDDSNIVSLINITNLDNNSKAKLLKPNSFEVNFQNNNLTTDLQLTFDYILKDTIKNYKYGIASIEYSECSCVSGYSDEKIIITKDSIFTSVENNETLTYDCINNTIRIQDPRVSNIKFVDILGRELGTYEVDRPMSISLANISTNVIFGIIKINNTFEIKRFYKCY